MKHVSSLFPDNNLSENDIIELLFPSLLPVLDQNHIRKEHLTVKCGKSYSSVYLLNFLVFRLCTRNNANYFSVAIDYKGGLPSDANTGINPKDRGFIKVFFCDEDEVLKYSSFLSNVLNQIIDRIPKGFDCCSRYLSCSEAMHCVHPDWDLSMQCGYKKILKRGNCYYGNNRNVVSS